MFISVLQKKSLKEYKKKFHTNEIHYKIIIFCRIKSHTMGTSTNAKEVIILYRDMFSLIQ